MQEIGFGGASQDMDVGSLLVARTLAVDVLYTGAEVFQGRERGETLFLDRAVHASPLAA